MRMLSFHLITLCALFHFLQEAFVTFRAVYAYKHGTTRENQILVEKSRFLRVGEGSSARWLYREKIPIDAAAEAAWNHLPAVVEEQVAMNEVARKHPSVRPRVR